MENNVHYLVGISQLNYKLACVTKCPTVPLPTCLNTQMVNKNINKTTITALKSYPNDTIQYDKHEDIWNHNTS